MPKFHRFTILALALALLLVPTLGLAQFTRTTGALIGTVTDPQGNALPGVSVTVTGPTLQGSRTEVSNGQGEYILPQLPPGTYRAEYSLSGAKTNVRSGVIVSLNQATKLNVQMQFAVSETMTVTASTVTIDPTQTTTQQNFKTDHLKYAVVGSNNRSYQNVLAQAPGVGGPNGAGGAGGGGNPQVSGANNAQNNYLLDGINTTDPVTHTFGNNMAFDAIQEISIQTLGKDAEYGSSGGTVNVITKSGGNNFSGTADWRYRDNQFQTQGKNTHPTGIAYFGATPTGSAVNFDKNLRPSKSTQPQGTLGGPLLRDRLWFFAAVARSDTAVTNPNLFGFQPGTRAFKGWNNLAKATFTPAANQTLTATYISNYARIPFSRNSSFYSPEADSLQTQGGRTYGLTYDTIITSKWLASVQAGHTPAYLSSSPISGNLTTPGSTDLGTGINTINFTNNQARRSTRDEFLGTTTYYVEGFGTHAVKVGLDHNKTDFNSYNNAVGDPSLIPGMPANFCSPANGFPTGTTCVGFLEPLNGAPFRVAVSAQNPRNSVNSKSNAGFVQDEWNPVPRATVRAGIRYETVTWGVSGKSVPDFKLFQPRLGVAYDVFNNASSVVHGFAGKVMDDNQLTLPNFGVAQLQGTAIFSFNTTTQKYVYSPSLSGVGISGGAYDPTLKPSYSNQYSIGFTQKVWRNTSLDVTGEYRKQHNLFEDYCGNLTVGFFDQCILTNHPGADSGVTNALRSDYRGVITKVESRPYSWLDVTASWTHSSSRGSTESTQNQDTSFDFYPAHFINRYGYLSDDARNRVKLDGYVRLPLDFTVGLNYYWDDGTPWTVSQTASTTSVTNVVLPYGNYFIEPRGSRRLPDFSQTDLQIQKDFRVGPTKLGLIATVYNVFNSETVISVNGNAGSRAIADPTTGKLFVGTGTVTSGGNQVPYQQAGPNRISSGFSQPTGWQTPRRYEAGVRIEF